MSVALSKAVLVDVVPGTTKLYIGDLEHFALWYTSPDGGSADIQVSPVASPGAGDWYTLGTLTTGKIMTNPAGLPTGQLGAWRALWVRASENAAGTHSLTLTGSLKSGRGGSGTSGGGGGGSVNSVSAGTGITVTGTATDPVINNAGVLTVVAGTGISVSGTANRTVTNTGVITTTAGTGISLTGTAANPVINNTGVTSVTAGTGISLSGTGAAPVVNNSGVLALTAGVGISITGTVANYTVTATGAVPTLQGAYNNGDTIVTVAATPVSIDFNASTGNFLLLDVADTLMSVGHNQASFFRSNNNVATAVDAAFVFDTVGALNTFPQTTAALVSFREAGAEISAITKSFYYTMILDSRGGSMAFGNLGVSYGFWTVASYGAMYPDGNNLQDFGAVNSNVKVIYAGIWDNGIGSATVIKNNGGLAVTITAAQTDIAGILTAPSARMAGETATLQLADLNSNTGHRPVVTPGTGITGGGSSSIAIEGGDTFGKITFTAGLVPVANGTLFTFAPNTNYSAVPAPVLALDFLVGRAGVNLGVDDTTLAVSGFTVKGTLVAAATYILYYHIGVRGA